MKYMGSLYAVDDKERTIAFYKEVCGLRVIQDFGTNFTMTGGISFQTRESWSGFLERSMTGDKEAFAFTIRTCISSKSVNHCLLSSAASHSRG